MKITVLIENTAIEPLKCEHGLSMFIEFQGNKYLLDAGTTDLFLENAKQLNVPVCDVSICVLSHGHYDHSGGFGTYLRENENASVYMMQAAGEAYYSGSGDFYYIGIPQQILKEHGNRFRKITEITKIDENVYLVPHFTQGLESIGKRAKLYVKQGEDYFPDDFSHELSLVFDTEQGLVILNSCSHGGAENIIREVKAALPGKKLYAFLGGLHMKGKRGKEEICTFSEEEIALLVDCLKREGLKYVYTGHCTGAKGIEMLKQYAGDLIQELTAGRIIEL